MSTDQILLSGDQVEALREALGSYADGEQLQITQQGDGTIVAGFSLATLSIAPNGEIEEN